jgi:hypothetical protein
VKCFSGCTQEEILAAVGITWKQLYYADFQKLDPKAYAEAQRKRKAAENAEARRRSQVRYWTDETRKWESVAGWLLWRVLRDIGGAIMVALWHKALGFARMRCERLRALQKRKEWIEVGVYSIRRLPKEVETDWLPGEFQEVLG